MNTNILKKIDPDLYRAIKQENIRQEEYIELIASENYASKTIMELQGSQLTNKYAEGYCNKRYYAGCEYIDIIEKLAIDRAKLLFNADYVNVQPHSGSQANAAVFLALLKPGDTVLGMKLSDGGHLTHGAHVNFSGKIYNSIQYGVDKNTGIIDYNSIENLAKKYNPKMIISGFSAYSQIIDWDRFRYIADKVNAYLLSDISHVAGLIASNLYPSPINIADVVTTTTHKTLRGPRGGIILSKKNSFIEKKLNSAVFPGYQGGPLMHVIAAKALCFKEAMTKEFKIYQKQILDNAKTMSNVLNERGYTIVSKNTKNHLLLIDLRNKKITGKTAEKVLHNCHITVNKNTVPNDPETPFITSGIRIGSPAITTRGFKEKESAQVAHWICDILENINNKKILIEIKEKVKKICSYFPVYTE